MNDQPVGGAQKDLNFIRNMSVELKKLATSMPSETLAFLFDMACVEATNKLEKETKSRAYEEDRTRARPRLATARPCIRNGPLV